MFLSVFPFSLKRLCFAPKCVKNISLQVTISGPNIFLKEFMGPTHERTSFDTMYNRKEKASQGKVSAFKRSLNSYSTNYQTFLMSDASPPWSKQNFWRLFLRSRFQRCATTYVISICQKKQAQPRKNMYWSISSHMFLDICECYHLYSYLYFLHSTPTSKCQGISSEPCSPP